MSRTIVGKRLTQVDVATDGRSVRLNLTDADDHAASLELPLECVNQMIMTLPRVLNRALKVQYRDSSMRLVFPLKEWRLERVAGDARLIMTLETEGGFEVAFTVEGVEIERMRETVSAAAEQPAELN